MEAENFFVRWLVPEADLVFADGEGKTFLKSRGGRPRSHRGYAWAGLECRLVWEF